MHDFPCGHDGTIFIPSEQEGASFNGTPEKQNTLSWRGKGDCPSAPSRAPGCGVHWSEAETLARKERTDQVQTHMRKGKETVRQSDLPGHRPKWRSLGERVGRRSSCRKSIEPPRKSPPIKLGFHRSSAIGEEMDRAKMTIVEVRSEACNLPLD